MKKLVVVVLFLNGMIFGQDAIEPITIEWKPIEFASYYVIEIQNESGQVIFKETTKDTKIAVRLLPGKYQKRLSVYNLYEELEAISSWSVLNVLVPDGVRIKIEWKEVPLAKSYILEIQDSHGNIIKEKNTEDTLAWFRLKPGAYQKRLSIVNQAGEVEAIGDWSPLNVILVLTPKIKDQQHRLKTLPEIQELQVEGENFEEGILVFISSDTGKIPIKKMVRLNEKKIHLVIDLKEIPVGKYDLKLVSSRGKTAISKNYILLSETELTEKTKHKFKNWEILLRSSIVPGWGEIYAGNQYENSGWKLRGIVYSSLFFTSFLYQEKLKADYRSQTSSLNNMFALGAAGILAGGNQKALALGTSYSLLQSKKNIQQTVSMHNTMSHLLVLVYLVQVVDAYFINTGVNSLLEEKKLQVNLGQQEFLTGKENTYRIYYTISY
jgi:hypothetical protein